MANIDTLRPIELIVVTVVAVIAIAIVTNALVVAGLSDGSASVNATTTENTTLDGRIDSIPASVTVRATTETALAFDGTNVVESSTPKNVTDGSWTICTTAELGSDANANATYDLVGYENASVLLQYDAGAWRVYYDNGTHDATARIDAPAPKNGLTPVCGRYNETSDRLHVIREGEFSSPAGLTSSTAPLNVSWAWEGRQDEVRIFGNAVSNTTISEYATDPIRPQPTEQRLARFMFDEGSGDTTTVYFASSTASVSGLDWTNGVSNPRKWLGLASAIDEGDDYVLTSEPFGIRIVEGGYLDGAPVVHVNWSETSLIGFIMGFIPVLFGVLVIVVIGNEVRDYV